MAFAQTKRGFFSYVSQAGPIFPFECTIQTLRREITVCVTPEIRLTVLGSTSRCSPASPCLFIFRPSGTILSSARRLLTNSCIYAATSYRQNKTSSILTGFFSSERRVYVYGLPRVVLAFPSSCSLAKVRWGILLQGRKYHLQCSRHGGEPMLTILWSGLSVIAHETEKLVYGHMHGSTRTTPLESAVRSISLCTHLCLPCITGQDMTR